MEIHLKIVGYLFVALALIHAVIPKYFRWDELKIPTLITRQILYVHTFFIGLAILLMGILCIGYSSDLVRSSLGRAICLGLFVFWFTRLVFQFVGYSPRTWRGKRFETTMHIVFSVLWIYCSAVFLLSYFNNNPLNYP